MAQYYKFAIIRFAPDDTRDERLNIGIVIFTDTGVDIRMPLSLKKIRALSPAIDTVILRELMENIKEIDSSFGITGIEISQRIKRLSRVGPLTLSEAGTFVAQDERAYENRISSIMKTMVDLELVPHRVKEKRTKLLTQVKQSFNRQHVLATKGEDLDSHRIVSRYELATGLVADFVLRNGVLHVIETIDASGDYESSHRAIVDIGMASLILEHARIKFGASETKRRLVYQASAALENSAAPSLEVAKNQGALLTNWASDSQRNEFIRTLSDLAIPKTLKRRGSFKRPAS